MSSVRSLFIRMRAKLKNPSSKLRPGSPFMATHFGPIARVGSNGDHCRFGTGPVHTSQPLSIKMDRHSPTVSPRPFWPVACGLVAWGRPNPQKLPHAAGELDISSPYK